MKYMGRKNRHSKDILPIILSNRKKDQWYVEPFVGGANIIDKVDGKRIGADINEYLISLWGAVSNGWMPPKDITEEQYNRMKKEKSVDPLTGYSAFALSYGGKFFGGWRRDSKGDRDYVDEAYRNAAEQFPKLSGVTFIKSDYKNLIIPDNSLIYCDPPYANTTGYRDRGFDHKEFWEWCRTMAKNGHTIFVSEYSAPEDFKCVWEKPVTSSLTKDTGSKRNVERLFTARY